MFPLLIEANSVRNKFLKSLFDIFSSSPLGFFQKYLFIYKMLDILLDIFKGQQFWLRDLLSQWVTEHVLDYQLRNNSRKYFSVSLILVNPSIRNFSIIMWCCCRNLFSTSSWMNAMVVICRKKFFTCFSTHKVQLKQFIHHYKIIG